MVDVQTVAAVPDLGTLGNVVPEGYSYYEKQMTPGQDLSLPNAYLKWYNLHPADAPVTVEQDAECRAFLQAEIPRLTTIQNELGFVILHRAGSFLLLMVMTWRNTNEIWESVYFKDVTQPGAYRLNAFDTTHRGTYCVWEMGIVWHERNAWTRFLSSKRDDEAKLAYINDRISGQI